MSDSVWSVRVARRLGVAATCSSVLLRRAPSVQRCTFPSLPAVARRSPSGLMSHELMAFSACNGGPICWVLHRGACHYSKLQDQSQASWNTSNCEVVVAEWCFGGSHLVVSWCNSSELINKMKIILIYPTTVKNCFRVVDICAPVEVMVPHSKSGRPPS
jgi:hypothetical protein